MCVRSAMVSVPVLAPPLFDDTRNATVPSPSPLALDVMVIQSALLRAVQVHPAIADTVTLALSASDVTV